MNKGLIIGLVIVIILLIAAGYYFSRSTGGTFPAQTQRTIPQSTQSADGFDKQTFDNIKTPHYVSSNPANNSILDLAPSEVKIDFNFDLSPPSKINVSANGKDVTFGSTEISSDKLSMMVPVSISETGNYKVNYTACWPDGSCHNGSFGFSVKL